MTTTLLQHLFSRLNEIFLFRITHVLSVAYYNLAFNLYSFCKIVKASLQWAYHSFFGLPFNLSLGNSGHYNRHQPPQPQEQNPRPGPPRRYRTTNGQTVRGEAFQISRSSHKTLSIEIRDGGLCLEDEEDYAVVATPENHLPMALRAMLPSLPDIVKLDLFASHFRAHLTPTMIVAVLQALPCQLQHLQLGGLRLTVEELCLILQHPELSQLTQLALYDLELVRPSDDIANDDNNHNNGPIDDTTDNKTVTFTQLPWKLQLQQVVAVFLRLEDDTVRLDPLLQVLEKAPNLHHLELVLDHNHAYLHGRPRPPQQAEHVSNQHRDNLLFAAKSFQNLLIATKLQSVLLEYVPLDAGHFDALLYYASHLKQLRIREESCNHHPNDTRRALQTGAAMAITATTENTITASSTRQGAVQALANLLQYHATLETVILDGYLANATEGGYVLRHLAHSSSINSLRLRTLSLYLSDLTSLLANNRTLKGLCLHNLQLTCPSANNRTTPELVELTTFQQLAQTLQDHNTTLRRLSWKQADFRRTEAFPHRRKSRVGMACGSTSSSLTKEQLQALLQAHQQLHYYLTLNQRNIRRVLVDATQTTRHDFLALLRDQQPSSWHEAFQQKVLEFADEDEKVEEDYGLDCMYYLLLQNPAMCCG